MSAATGVRVKEAVRQSDLCPSAGHIVQEDAPAAPTKRDIDGPLCCKASLSACHAGINTLPVVVAHCAPVVAHTDLHTTLCGVVPSNQPDVSIAADYNVNNIITRLFKTKLQT